MEHAGAVSDHATWPESFGPAPTGSVDESDVIAQLFGNSGLFSSETHHELDLEAPSMYWPPEYDGPCAYYSSRSDAAVNSNYDEYHWRRGACDGGGTAAHFSLPNLELEGRDDDHGQYYYSDVGVHSEVAALQSEGGCSFFPMEPCMGNDKCDATKEILLDEPACYVDETSNGSSEQNVSSVEPISSSPDHKHPPKRKPAVDFDKDKEEDSQGSPPRKKVQKNGKNAQSKRGQRSKKTGDRQEEENLGLNSCSSEEDESCESQDTNGEGGGVSSGTPKGSKSRAGRGSATDPQSLYARKRRERINERLKILQNLVPNGTKVDISTMLEEAVQYVKFLQLQIKLLSSDDLWMYAPIAYNGMNIGLDLKISP